MCPRIPSGAVSGAKVLLLCRDSLIPGVRFELLNNPIKLIFLLCYSTSPPMSVSNSIYLVSQARTMGAVLDSSFSLSTSQGFSYCAPSMPLSISQAHLLLLLFSATTRVQVSIFSPLDHSKCFVDHVLASSVDSSFPIRVA